MIKGILFDYGGTLDTAAEHWSYIIHKGYHHAGVDLTQEDFREAYVFAERALARTRYILPKDDFFTLLYKKVTIEIEYLISHNMWKPQSYDERVRVTNEISLYCDNFARNQVKESESILRQLKGKYKMVMVSNFYGNLRTVLEGYGIDAYFEKIVESAVVGIRKPDPKIYELGVKEIGLKPDECIVVGDSFKKDIIPGKEIGCQTVWFKGREWEDISYDEQIPTYIIRNLRELKKII